MVAANPCTLRAAFAVRSHWVLAWHRRAGRRLTADRSIHTEAVVALVAWVWESFTIFTVSLFVPTARTHWTAAVIDCRMAARHLLALLGVTDHLPLPALTLLTSPFGGRECRSICIIFTLEMTTVTLGTITGSSNWVGARCWSTQLLHTLHRAHPAGTLRTQVTWVCECLSIADTNTNIVTTFTHRAAPSGEVDGMAATWVVTWSPRTADKSVHTLTAGAGIQGPRKLLAIEIVHPHVITTIAGLAAAVLCGKGTIQHGTGSLLTQHTALSALTNVAAI